jgi:hypothetical protein
MTTVFVEQDGRITVKNGQIGVSQECCCKPSCDAQFSAAGGAGTTETTHLFPSSEQSICINYDAFIVPDQFIVEACGTQYVDTGSISGSGCADFTKPEGCTEVKVTVIGPEGTAWTYNIACCLCPPPPPLPCEGVCDVNEGGCLEKEQPCSCCCGQCQEEPCEGDACCCNITLCDEDDPVEITFKGHTGPCNDFYLSELQEEWSGGANVDNEIGLNYSDWRECGDIYVPGRAVSARIYCEDGQWKAEVEASCGDECNEDNEPTVFTNKRWTANMECDNEGRPLGPVDPEVTFDDGCEYSFPDFTIAWPP